MTNVLPPYTGLAVNGVVYQYTTVKETEDEMTVYVQNENAIDTGYIFREKDEWTGIPQNTINRVVPVDYIPLEYWGDGSIVVEGQGEVVDATVIYTYRYDDTCVLDPQASPDCPGYVPEIPELTEEEAYDPMDEDYIQDELDRKATLKDEEEEDRQREKVKKEGNKKKRETLASILGIDNLGEMASIDEALHNALVALDNVPQSYTVALPTTEYEETVVLKDAVLPDNNRVRRNFAQDELHDQIVNSQYEN